jgi:hypothetical protein
MIAQGCGRALADAEKRRRHRDVGGYTHPITCMNLKRKGLQNGFPEVTEKKGEYARGHEFQNGNWRVNPGTSKCGAPVFFVSVASKGVNKAVSLLFATLGLC